MKGIQDNEQIDAGTSAWTVAKILVTVGNILISADKSSDIVKL